MHGATSTSVTGRGTINTVIDTEWAKTELLISVPVDHEEEGARPLSLFRPLPHHWDVIFLNVTSVPKSLPELGETLPHLFIALSVKILGA